MTQISSFQDITNPVVKEYFDKVDPEDLHNLQTHFELKGYYLDSSGLMFRPILKDGMKDGISTYDQVITRPTSISRHPDIWKYMVLKSGAADLYQRDFIHNDKEEMIEFLENKMEEKGSIFSTCDFGGAFKMTEKGDCINIERNVIYGLRPRKVYDNTPAYAEFRVLCSGKFDNSKKDKIFRFHEWK